MFILSCSQNPYRTSLERMMSSTVVLPDDAKGIRSDVSFLLLDSLKDVPKLIIYIDSSQCTSCKVGKLLEYTKLFKLSDETKLFQPLIIITLPHKELSSVSQLIQRSRLPFPVYIDVSGSFRSTNPQIPDNPLFHCFYINKTGSIEFVGNPLRSEKMYKMFLSKML